MAARWEGEATCGGTAEVSGGRAISETATGPNLVGGTVRDEALEELSAISYQLSAISYRRTAVGARFLACCGQGGYACQG